MTRGAIIRENIRISLQSIRTNLLRAILTMLIISFGIMALVGILTAIESIKNSLNSQFSSMGANTFALIQKGNDVHRQGFHYRTINSPRITYEQAREFKQNFKFPALVALSTQLTGTATVKYKSEKTNPNINAWGVDENDVYTSGKTIDIGRNFSEDDIKMNKHVAILGFEVAKKIFKNNENPLGKVVSIGDGKYKVIGVLKDKGASMGGGDRTVLLPISNARQYFSTPNQTFRVYIMPINPEMLDIATSEAEGLFRTIRKLKAKDETDFTVEASNSLAEMLINSIQKVTIAATIIGVITLFGAAIGLMNIMLVSVTERTSEIGIRKALGAKPKTIKLQFLYEAIIIGQFGGFLGIFLGILIGNILSLMMGGHFFIPWLWVLSGVTLCFLVGIVAGYVPAMKAAKVDPIISLRYE
jgi:putative ABC transport system permease protein